MAAFEGRASEIPEPVALALSVAADFGLGQVAASSQFESFGNENWLVETVDGSRTVLKRYMHANPARVEFQLRFQQYLLQRGFPTAQVLATASGDLFKLDGAGVAWTASSYVDGREYDFGLEDATEAASRLAEFHLLGQGLDTNAPELMHRPSIRDCWANVEEDLRGLQELFEGVAVQDELSYLREWWRSVLKDWPVDRLDSLPHGFVHGDYHGRNLAFARGRVLGVFDFDDVEHGPLVHDLAFGAHKFGRESRGSLKLRPEVVRAFTAEYERVRPLSPEERAALPVMMAMSYPPNPRYDRYYRDHHGTNIEARLRREVNAMRTLRAEVAAIFRRRI